MSGLRWLDLYAGPGGIDVALTALEMGPVLGIERDGAACDTRRAAGHATLQADVADVEPGQFAGVEGLAGGPPCPPFSNAGSGGGKRDMPRLLDAVSSCRTGWTDAALAGPWEDDRTPHVLQPLRYAWTLRQKYVFLEQVPQVLPVWEAAASVLQAWGYNAAAFVLNAADFGVPQTRRRAFLVASRTDVPALPRPTHAVSPLPSMFCDEPAGWITMAEALGWGPEMHGYVLDRRQDGAPVVDPWLQPCPTITASALASGIWRLRPRTSVVTAPGSRYVPGQDYSDARAVTVAEGAHLQQSGDALPVRVQRHRGGVRRLAPAGVGDGCGRGDRAVPVRRARAPLPHGPQPGGLSPRSRGNGSMTLDLHLFGGPGGFDVGAAMVGRLRAVGLEWEESACRTRAAAGHATIRTDVAVYPVEPFVGRVEGMTGGPPCPTFSKAGKGDGRAQLGQIIERVYRCRGGWTDAALDGPWTDPRTPLVLQPLRFIHAIRPEWVVLEQVPDVLPVWEAYARVLAGWGYRVVTAALCAADYGVPQTRERAVLIASRTRAAALPRPTHAEHPEEHASLFGDVAPRRWVYMADALGWGLASRPAYTLAPGTGSGGPDLVGGSGARAQLRKAIASGDWVHLRPATTVVGSYSPHVVAAPVYRDRRTSRQDSAGSVSVTIEEHGMLQSFPRDYPWQGNKGQKFQQSGNACPPLFAAHLIAAATGRSVSPSSPSSQSRAGGE